MKREDRKTAVVFLAFYALWQASALLHLFFVPHVILDSGRITDIDPETGDPRQAPENGAPVDENCPYLTQLTAAQTLVSQTFQFNPSIDVSQVLVDPILNRETPRSIDILHLSPSTSPPFSV